MMILQFLTVGAGGSIGAVLRWFLSNKMNEAGKFPAGTFLVNAAGSLLIGLIVGLQMNMWATLFLVSGFAGGLTTFSTLNKELLSLWSDRKRIFFIYLFSTYSIGILFAAIGFMIGHNI
ncbi:putative fluoride ion transporter CrcB 2 [Sporosarcina sp. NCCP-2222]|uniref:fluoride efflux transporter FluC n=1 Tax=Sporosarcina sp. NCCP-2222 TaxID=2935073 RepID=UPI002083FD89|nr:CrcB family protein [Sporosarcina sp. NCCP-2222]GKV55889.1 putative fluoride ion transporter CrcB 2 [Sporosarcina sp. NCCP-2222]